MYAVRGIGPIHATVLALAISATAAVAQAPRDNSPVTFAVSEHGATIALEWPTFGGEPAVNIFRRVLVSATLGSTIEIESDGPATRISGELFAGPLVDDDPQMPWWGPSLGQTLAPFLEIVSAVLDVRPTILPTAEQVPFNRLESSFVQAVTERPIVETHPAGPTDAARNETTGDVEAAPEPRREHAGDVPTTASPEPASMMLMATGLASVGASVIRRRRRKN